eukprot:TRINITY_DN7000_c0_g1_i1.p1 TRINITY_DN7000_c0_g1~~TRINITY_DN7000_c0_g1_i1.p1  ORF type:complete len:303 (-),score=69.34 TRINITY_DN7000_c0_g1_i1:279-1187(-)
MKQRPSDEFLAGGISGAITRFLVAPLDVVKIRLQLQTESLRTGGHPGGASPKYAGVAQALRTIATEEGLKALWKGNLTAELLWTSYVGVQFAVYSHVLHLLAAGQPKHDPASSFVAGGLGGFAATVTTYPLDLVRTRLAAQAEPKVYRGLTDACRTIWLSHGAHGFLQGLTPTLAQIVPHMAFHFMFYETFKGAHAQGSNFGALQQLTSGALSGMLAKCLTHPFDVVKKRLQVSGFNRGGSFTSVVYGGLVDCVRTTLRAEGVRGLYKGLKPNLLKAGIASALTFLFYEQTLRVLKTARAGS